MLGGYAPKRYDEDKINYIIITTGYEASARGCAGIASSPGPNFSLGLNWLAKLAPGDFLDRRSM